MKKIIALLLSVMMVISSVSVFAAPTDKAQAAEDYIKVFTDGTGERKVRDMGVETLIGKNTPDVHKIEAAKNEYFNFTSTLDMAEVEHIFNGMKYALTLESAETQALFADAEIDGHFTIKIVCDGHINYDDAEYGFEENGLDKLEPTIFADPEISVIKAGEDTPTGYADIPGGSGANGGEGGTAASPIDEENDRITVVVDTVDGLMLEDLDTTLLHDIKFFVNKAKCSTTGTHQVAVTMTGRVDLVVDEYPVGTITFETNDSGESHIAMVTVKSSGGGGGTGTVKRTVTFDTNGGSSISPVKVDDGSKLTLPKAPVKAGYTFEGWYMDEALTIPFDPDMKIEKDMTLYAKWSDGEGEPSGDGMADIIIKGEEDKEIDTEKEDVKISDLEIPERDGFIFGGWFEDPGYNKQLEDDYVIKEGDKVYGRWVNATVPEALEDTDHFAYIIGYPDETVRPENNVSREEVATMFYRLMKPDYREKMVTRENNFPDVQAERWSVKAISTMANAGFINGYPNGTFGPERSITRAEFATIAARMYADDYDKKYAANFKDISGHWAEKDILKLSAYECIFGDGDGLFRPDAKITRAEAIAIINRMIVRYVNHEGLHEYAIHWVDNLKTRWYYFPVLEATNSHDYERQLDLYNEDWHEINPNIDWEADQYN